MTYALDSSIVIHLLNRNESVCAKKDEAVAAGERFIIPPVVDYEIRRGFFYKSYPKKEAVYLTLAGHYGIGEMTAGAWNRSASLYAKLRRKNFTIGDADIFIASFCIVNSFVLVTDNTKHFESIDSLQLVNWSE